MNCYISLAVIRLCHCLAVREAQIPLIVGFRCLIFLSLLIEEDEILCGVSGHVSCLGSQTQHYHSQQTNKYQLWHSESSQFLVKKEICSILFVRWKPKALQQVVALNFYVIVQSRAATINTSRWHGTLNNQRLNSSMRFPQTLLIVCLSILHPNSRTLILIEIKRKPGPLSNSPLLFLFKPGTCKMHLMFSIVSGVA